MSIIKNLVRKCQEPSGPANILTMFYDGHYCLDLARTGHIFYGSDKHCPAGWFPVEQVPSNIKFINVENENWKTLDSMDLVLNQSPVNTDFIKNFTMGLHLPAINVSHEAWPPSIIRNMDYSSKSYKNVVDNENTLVSNEFQVIPRAYSPLAHSADEKDIECLIYGDFLPQDYGVLNRLAEQIPGTLIYGDSPGLSTPVKGQEFYDLFARTKIFINLASLNHISHYLLTALKSGCAVVSNKTDYLKAQLKDAVRFSENVDKSGDIVRWILDNPNELFFLNKEGQAYVEKNHTTIDTFVSSWNKLIDDSRREIFTT